MQSCVVPFVQSSPPTPECDCLAHRFGNAADHPGRAQTGRHQQRQLAYAGRLRSESVAALRYFALNGTDHRSHSEQNAAIGAYIRWHNTRAEPKTNFAPDSPIRTWTNYPAKAA